MSKAIRAPETAQQTTSFRGGEGRISGKVGPWRRGWLAEAAEPRRNLPRAAPVKRAPWEPYMPVYFWLGGIAAGAWSGATIEDWLGNGDRQTVRLGRYLATGTTLAGTSILIADLGRSERFLHMLRLIQPRSAMSLGSWGLATFGTIAGLASALQAGEDLLGKNSPLGRLSHGKIGRGINLAGLPLALFVGSYTGFLLSSTSTPAWARQRFTLPTLFLASGIATGMSTVAALTSTLPGRRGMLNDTRSGATERRLARAAAVAFVVDLALSLNSNRQSARLPSGRGASPGRRRRDALTILVGSALPLVLSLRQGREAPLATRLRRVGLGRRTRPQVTPIITALAALAGGLATRFSITTDGYQSTQVAEDTWALTRKPERASIALAPREEDRRPVLHKSVQRVS